MNLDAQIAWQAQHFVNLDVQISWQAQHFVNLDVREEVRKSSAMDDSIGTQGLTSLHLQ